MMSAGCADADCGSVTMPASTNTIIADFIFGLLSKSRQPPAGEGRARRKGRTNSYRA
jgi:hypothetical protein